ncbi:hypothetical protein [Myxacorys almedinensis]|uniref:Uncharacterized protein n=1 Tax=Myxacorys almedinensis A TaxID=2690445 RepID=A0A8J7YZX3_9CYAN|nr:hypothetical protein [Myxacorys almedinensis]NDJ17682.1 hypothetical protein [Myxacorys almedinensis A]
MPETAEWEFLLQQEGDRSWLPLDAPDAEILEGRYRIMARSRYRNSVVEVQIAHEDLGSDPPKRRTQQRTQQTNQNGLLVVIPYTTLSPGSWEIVCASTDLLVDLMGDRWQHTVRLHVLSCQSDDDSTDDWNADWQADNGSDLGAFSRATGGEEHSAESEAEDITTASASAAPASYAAEAFAGFEPLPYSEESIEFEPLSFLETAEETAELASDPTRQNLSEPIVQGSPGDAETLSPALSEIAEVERLMAAAPEEVEPEVNAALPLAAADPEGSEDEGAIAQMPPADVIAQAEFASVEQWLENAELMSQQIADEILHEYGLSPDELTVSRDRVEAPVPSITALPPLQIDLAQSTYIARRGETLVLTGRITPTDEEETDDVPMLVAALLNVVLRDPRTGETLLETQEAIASQALPTELTYQVTLPSELTTQLILGEVTLYDMSYDHEGESFGMMRNANRVLASQPFTLTAGAEELLDAIAQQAASGAAQASKNVIQPAEVAEQRRLAEDLPSTPLCPPQPVSLDLAFLSMVEPVRSPQFESLASDIKQSLPPQLFTAPLEPRRKGLDLPNFSSSASAPPRARNPFALEDFEFDHPGIEQLSLFDPPEPQTVDLTNLKDPIDESSSLNEEGEEVAPFGETVEPSGLDPASQASAMPPASEQSTPIQSTFQALNLQDRFLDRLNLLASEPNSPIPAPDDGESVLFANVSDLSKALEPDRLGSEGSPGSKSPSEPFEGLEDIVRAEPDPAASAAEPLFRASPGLPDLPLIEEEPYSDEVVVDGEPILPLAKLTLSFAQKPSLVELHPDNNPFLLPAEQPVPMPVLEVLKSQLTGGDLMAVRVTLPDIVPKIYVKLWIHDRQSRVVLQHSRWISEFAPTGLEQVAAIVDLTVPLGSVEIEIAAIAVEMTTRRESHKTLLNLSITPPNFSDLDLGDDD